MELIKNLWIESDRQLFLDYLRTFQVKEKEAWSKRILNTKQEVLCIPTKTIGQIAKSISQGHYQSFLDLKIFDHYEAVAINGKIISSIKDFHQMKHYLDDYIHVMENWAHCDLLSFHINKNNKEQFLELSNQYLKSDHVFIRRLGLLILFQMVKDESVLDIIYKSLLSLKAEKEYYVIMMAGWLLCEAIIKYKKQTFDFINRSQDLNVKILNKGIQKCRESRRFTQEEKIELNTYKRK